MNKIIRFSKKGLSKRLNIIGLILIILLIVASFLLRDYIEIAYCLSAFLFFIFVLILSYKIRYYPQIIVLLDESISIEYLSKSIFRQKPYTGCLNDLSIEREKKQIILYNQKQIVAVIEKGAINEDEENYLFSILPCK